MKRIEVMSRASFVKHESRMVFVCNISDLEPEDALRVIKRSEDVIKRMPNKSALALAYLDNVKNSEEIKAQVQDLLEHCAPYVLKGAYCGVSDKKLKDQIECLLPSSGSNRKAFDSREQALNWLVASDLK